MSTLDTSTMDGPRAPGSFLHLPDAELEILIALADGEAHGYARVIRDRTVLVTENRTTHLRRGGGQDVPWASPPFVPAGDSSVPRRTLFGVRMRRLRS